MKKAWLPGTHAGDVCVACGAEPRYSIALAAADDEFLGRRYYLPNENVRRASAEEEVLFCHECIRALEDAFRATLLYRQVESQRPEPPGATRPA
ncbi:MAG: hypothetical protein ACYS0K_08860 [Planctomycetota bacterium]|jgi:hypothetical protein